MPSYTAPEVINIRPRCLSECNINIGTNIVAADISFNFGIKYIIAAQ
jgi:hypothetical protein